MLSLQNICGLWTIRIRSHLPGRSSRGKTYWDINIKAVIDRLWRWPDCSTNKGLYGLADAASKTPTGNLLSTQSILRSIWVMGKWLRIFMLMSWSEFRGIVLIGRAESPPMGPTGTTITELRWAVDASICVFMRQNGCTCGQPHMVGPMIVVNGYGTSVTVI